MLLLRIRTTGRADVDGFYEPDQPEVHGRLAQLGSEWAEGLHSGPATLGVITSVQAIGGIVGGFVVAGLGERVSPVLMLGAGSMVVDTTCAGFLGGSVGIISVLAFQGVGDVLAGAMVLALLPAAHAREATRVAV
ncbi:MAG: hypothetical protein ABIQ59_00420 [Nocardioidaceae bacterium]